MYCMLKSIDFFIYPSLESKVHLSDINGKSIYQTGNLPSLAFCSVLEQAVYYLKSTAWCNRVRLYFRLMIRIHVLSLDLFELWNYVFQ